MKNNTIIINNVIKISLVVLLYVIIKCSFSLIDSNIKSKIPEIKYVLSPIYFTNSIIILVPTNNIPLSNVVNNVK